MVEGTPSCCEGRGRGEDEGKEGDWREGREEGKGRKGKGKEKERIKG